MKGSLRGLGVAGCQILAFSIDLLHRPYNTLALPCECVINDLPDVVKTFAIISLFADDAKLSKHIKAPTDSLELKEATTTLYAWSKNGC